MPKSYAYAYGPLDRVLAGQGSGISLISSEGVLAAIFKKRTSPPMALGIFQGTPYAEDIEEVSQQLVHDLMQREDVLPAHLICLLYNHGDFSELEFRSNMPCDALQRVRAAPFYAPPSFQKKPATSLDIHFSSIIVNESTPTRQQARLRDEARQLSDLGESYGLTRTEVLYRCAVEQALQRIDTHYQGEPLHARAFNLFFARLLGTIAPALSA